MVKYVVIGAGINGSSIAREIKIKSKNSEVIVVEKENEFGEHTSGRHSGVLHSGINLKPGSFKSIRCIEGNKMARSYCKENNIKIEECGTIVGVREGLDEKKLNIEEKNFEKLISNCEKSKIEGWKILTKEEVKEMEPNINVRKALFSPNGAIMDGKGFLESIIKESKWLGVEYFMNTEVKDIKNGNKNIVVTNKKEFEADYIINAAGLYSDKIAHMMNVGLEYEIIPFRGEYFKINNLKVNSMVYVPPDPNYPFLGIHLTKTTDGDVIAGPNAVLSFGRESYNKEINFFETMDMIFSHNFLNLIISKEFLKLVYHNIKTSMFKNYFLEEIRKIAPFSNDIISYKSGIRAQIVDDKGKMIDDMIIEYTKNSTHILNAVSPGITCSLSFANYFVNNLMGLK